MFPHGDDASARRRAARDLPSGESSPHGRADLHSLGIVRPRIPKPSLGLAVLASLPLQLGLFATGAGAQSTDTTTTTAPPTTTTTAAPPTTTTTTAPPTTTTS